MKGLPECVIAPIITPKWRDNLTDRATIALSRQTSRHDGGMDSANAGRPSIRAKDK